MKWKYVLLAGLIIVSLFILVLSELLLRGEDKHPGEPRFSQSVASSKENHFFIASHPTLKDSVGLSQHSLTLYFDSAFSEQQRNNDTLLRWAKPVQGEVFEFVRDDIHLRDTLIHYSIEGISAEGSEVMATYQQNTLRNAQWIIYGETGKTIIRYQWIKNGGITATEHYYRYKTNLTNVQSDQYISLVDSVNYIMNRNGQITSIIVQKDFENLYPIFTKHVPLIIDKDPH